jgi:uncharacterized protein
MQRLVNYFDKPGPRNTDTCLELTRELVSLGAAHVVAASTSGDSGLVMAQKMTQELAAGLNLVVVGHSANFREPGHLEFTAENRSGIEAAGGKVLITTILTHSFDVAFSGAFGGYGPTQIVAVTLRRLGQGVKVACEITMEACDAGLVPEGEEVVALGGTAKGWDTVCLIKAAPSKRFLDLFVNEIVAKPRR